MTIRPGLCSITLRGLPADEVIAVATRAGIAGIEWGADVHVPPGATTTAAEVARRGADAGLAVVSYGSYLGAGPPGPDEPATVAAVVESARALGAPTVRIWTQLGVAPDAPEPDRHRVRDRTAAIATAIRSAGLGVALEFHPGTLTHTAAATTALLEDLADLDVRTHWQPDPALTAAQALAELRAVAPRLAHLHVFAWGPGGIAERRALATGAGLWPAAFATVAAEAPPGERWALLEYVRDDDPEQVVADARTLRGWLAA